MPFYKLPNREPVQLVDADKAPPEGFPNLLLRADSLQTPISRSDILFQVNLFFPALAVDKRGFSTAVEGVAADWGDGMLPAGFAVKLRLQVSEGLTGDAAGVLRIGDRIGIRNPICGALRSGPGRRGCARKGSGLTTAEDDAEQFVGAGADDLLVAQIRAACAHCCAKARTAGLWTLADNAAMKIAERSAESPVLHTRARSRVAPDWRRPG